MSSARRLATAYGNAASGRNAKTGFTKTRFGDVGRKIDAESEKPKLQSRGFVETGKGLEEQRAKESEPVRQELEKIKEDEEKAVDKADFKSEVERPTVRKAPAKTDDELISKHKVGGVFSKAWTIADHVTVPEVVEPMKSSFMPNFISASVIITAIEHCLDGIEELKWISPFYFSLPARVYWAVLFYIQILKAKEASGKIGKSESTWFRAFKRVFPLESLPVIGPLVPYYTNIVSVKPNDDMYDFIFPEYAQNFGLSVQNGTPVITDSFFLQPNILLVSELLRVYCTMTAAQLEEVDAQGNLIHFDDMGNFIPHRIGGAFNFAGIDYPAALTVATSTTLSGVDLDKPLPESLDRLKQIHRYWQRSRTTGLNPPAQTNLYQGIGQAMRMDDGFEWFEDCIEMATIQCKFFSDSINMSQIPATGGSEALIGVHITGTHEQYNAATAWLPRNWRNLKSQFRTTRADTTSEQFMNAAYALTNGTISWTSNNHPIGGRQAGQRVGPYWNNRQFQFEQANNVEVVRRVETMLRSLFFDAHGQASI